MKLRINSITIRNSILMVSVASLLSVSGHSVAFGITPQMSSTAFYVNALSGSDSNSGTSPNSAWQTLAKVDSTTFTSGDTILFERGQVFKGQLHPLGSGILDAPITISSYGTGPLAEIVGDDISTGPAVYLLNQQYWTIENLDITNNSGSPNFGTLSNAGTSREGVLVEDAWGGPLSGITIANNIVSNVNGCFSCSDIDSHLNGGIVVEALNPNDSFHGITIAHNQVSQVGRSGIVFWDQSYYSSNYFEVDQSQLSTGILIEGNSATNIDGDGIIVFGAYAPLIEYNSVSNSSQKSIIGSSEAASVGLMTTRSIGAVIEHNEVSGTLTQTTDGEGYDVDLGSKDTTLEYNYSHNNQGGFLLAMGGASSNLTVRYNLSVNDGYSGLKGVFTLDSSQSNSSIYNNTIYIPSNSRANPILCQNCAGASVTSWSFINNIVDNFGSGIYSFAPNPGIEFSSNDFYGNHPAGQPADSSESEVNPLLSSPGTDTSGLISANSYSITSGSPVLRSGTIISANGGMDFFGDSVPNGSAPSEGFDQPGTPASYWLESASGNIYPFGGATSLGCPCGTTSQVGIAATSDGQGYWTVSSSGQVSAFGDAKAIVPLTPTGGLVVAIAGDSNSAGYWLATQQGSVESVGNAPNYGSPEASGIHLAAPLVSMARNLNGNGYWLLGRDGGVFAYGDAVFYGSTGSIHLHAPATAIASTPDGQGYWIIAGDGGVFAFGDAGFYGSTYQLNPGKESGGSNSIDPLNMPIVGILPSFSGEGYLLVGADGGVFAFGDAQFMGSLANTNLPDPIIAVGEVN